VGRLPRGEVAGARERIAAARAELGPASSPERRLALVFGLVAAAWIFRRPIPLGDLLTIPGWADLLGLGKVADDGTVAIAGALAMFLVPAGAEPPPSESDRPGRLPGPARLLDWETAVRIPWGIIILFGGGLALAGAFQSTGLSAYVGSLLGRLVTLPPVLLVLCVALGVTFLTEITSNTATTTILMPVLAATAVGTGTSPLVLMLTAALSASCAFMLPVATPPNAIVFGTDRVPIASMARVGFAINLAGAALITALVTLWGVPVLGG
jgi:solute carrier family 13 (sodium-dependent dicarboxylate transporter), member 2/3/5